MAWLRPRMRLPAALRRQGWSLRRRLLLAVIGTSVALWLLSLGVFIAVTWSATSEFYDEALEEGARLILQLDAGGAAGAAAESDFDDEMAQARKLRMYYQLVAADGRVLLRGRRTPDAAFVPEVSGEDDFVDVLADGELWRVHVRRGANGVSAQVAQPMEERLDLLEDATEALVWPALGLLVVLALLSWFIVRRLLRPLERTAARIAAKSPLDLSPLERQAPAPPQELQPVLDAIDALLARLARALDSERRFTSEAAHELRTPLAALRTRMQLVERQLQLPESHMAALRADLDRCTALVESLLTLARLDPQEQPLERRRVSLDALIDALDAKPAAARGMQLQRALAAPAVPGTPELLHIVLRNLLDNAVRYGRPGGRIRIESQTLPHGVVRLAVRDDGPGVSATERVRLGERFFRVLGTGASGNGLGLSIVRRIATLHGAALRFESGLEGSGLGVVLEFPPA